MFALLDGLVLFVVAAPLASTGSRDDENLNLSVWQALWAVSNVLVETTT